MKKILLFSIASALLFLNFQCDEEGVVIDFNYTYSDAKFTIPEIPVAGEQELPSVEMDLKMDSVLAANNMSKETIEAVKLSKMVFVITKPSNGNFNSIDYVEAKMSAPGAGLTEILIAKTPDPITKDVNSLEMVVEDVDLAQYIKAGVINLTMKVGTNDKIDEEMDVKLSMNFAISGKIL